MTQPSLFSRAPAVKPEDVERFVESLRGLGWVPARCFAVGPFRWNERKVRAVAAATRGTVVSGPKGYCHIADASVAEVQHFIAAMRSQARQMEQRALETERAMHRKSTAA